MRADADVGKRQPTAAVKIHRFAVEYGQLPPPPGDVTIAPVSREPPASSSPPSTAPTYERLDSWKEIAAYLKRDVTTVQRWEKREGMPVHRHLHDKVGSVSALRSELDTWAHSRRPAVSALAGSTPREPREPTDIDRVVTLDANATPIQSEASKRAPTLSFTRSRRVFVWGLAAVTALTAVAVLWRLERRDAFWRNPIADAKFAQVTDLDGTEQAVAISRDGKFVAFLANRDGHVDVWTTQVGTGQFHNLTHDVKRELVNPSLRTPGFSPDGALVTFWTRKPDPSPATDIGIWAVPILGGEPRPYLDGAAEFDWTSDGSRLVFHTPGPGDPMFVRDLGQTPTGRQIFAAPAGLHSHFLLWSIDQAFIYFVQGSLPEPMDIWRIKPTGGIPERITHHESRVSYPVFVNPRTLVYLATDATGAGPWLYSTDVERRIPHRVSSGVDTYTSLAASADGQRLVATRSTTRTSLWRSSTGAKFDTSAASRVSLNTDSAFSPRLGPGYVLYVSAQGETDTIWKQQGETATELWTAPEARILGGPAIDSDGQRIAFSARQGGQSLLYVMNADGTGARIVARSLEWQGSPAWAPDGRSITAAALDGGVPHLFSVSLDGGPPAPLGREQALDPTWSPDGRFVVFSGPDIGTTFPVKAMSADGSAYPLPSLMLSRGARHLRFFPGRRALLVLRGEIKHKDLWSIDLETGAEQQLTNLAPDFEVQDFDISPDGREVVLQRAQAHSEIVLLDLARR
jgi:Tol biopolymer transport system component